MNYETHAGKRAARMESGLSETGDDKREDFFRSEDSIEIQLGRLDDQLAELADRTGGLFHRFSPVLKMPSPMPEGDKGPTADSMQSTIYDKIGEQRDVVYRVNRQLEEFLDRCNL